MERNKSGQIALATLSADVHGVNAVLRAEYETQQRPHLPRIGHSESSA